LHWPLMSISARYRAPIDPSSWPPAAHSHLCAPVTEHFFFVFLYIHAFLLPKIPVGHRRLRCGCERVSVDYTDTQVGNIFYIYDGKHEKLTMSCKTRNRGFPNKLDWMNQSRIQSRIFFLVIKEVDARVFGLSLKELLPRLSDFPNTFETKCLI